MCENNSPSQYYLPFISAVLMALTSFSVFAQTTFNDVAAERGVAACSRGQEGYGFGASAADFDNDGDVDIYVARPENEPDRVYRNLGNGTFEDVAAQLGLDSNQRARGGLWFDYDGDDRLDLLITSDCFSDNCSNLESVLHLYRQMENGSFSDVTETAGLMQAPTTREQHRSGAAAGDLNGDGYPELVTGFWEGQLFLYLNHGDGTFTDVSVASGIGTGSRGNFQPVIFDFNGDGRLDLYTTVDFTENKLWLNQGTANGVPILHEVGGPSACDNAMNDMGVTIGDYDEDGDPDIYATNIFREERYNVLLRNDSQVDAPQCSDVSAGAGVQDGGWGWGTSFVDLDNNTYLDIAETNGWRFNGWVRPPRMFMQQHQSAPGTFVDQAANMGMTSDHWGSSLLAVDFDRDGDADLIESVADACYEGRTATIPLAIHENQLENTAQSSNHYLVVKPRTDGPNGRAIGAKVTVEFGERRLIRWITAGTSFLGQEPAEAFFGLGTASQVDRLIVQWPSGARTVQRNVAVDQIVTLLDRSVVADGFE